MDMNGNACGQTDSTAVHTVWANTALPMGVCIARVNMALRMVTSPWAPISLRKF